MFAFTIKKITQAGRLGLLKTSHGIIETPSFVPVGTQATVKTLTPHELIQIGVQVFFVNTYHMMIRPGIKIIKKFKGLHHFMAWPRPLITDSGGFQVFSLGRNGLVKIDEEGVTFRSYWDGRFFRLTPEKSIELQHDLGADLMIAFDDCPPYPVSYQEAQKSLQRTHRWAKRSLLTHQALLKKRKTAGQAALYGSIQGSVYRDLRIKSAQFISSLDFDGLAIGGVAVGESKKEMRDVLAWVVPILPVAKPRHLLGVGEIDDIFALVEAGIDTFDCVMPTRLARMGHILIKNSELKRKLTKNQTSFDILKSEFADDSKPLNKDCTCYTCCHFSRAYLHHLFKVKELLAYRLATIHNLYFVENLMVKIRQALKTGSLAKLKLEYL